MNIRINKEREREKNSSSAATLSPPLLHSTLVPLCISCCFDIFDQSDVLNFGPITDFRSSDADDPSVGCVGSSIDGASNSLGGHGWSILGAVNLLYVEGTPLDGAAVVLADELVARQEVD